MTPEIVVKFVTDLSEYEKGSKKVVDDSKKVEKELEKVDKTGSKLGSTFQKIAAFAGGTFVTAILAVGTAVYAANQQVDNFDKALKVSSGSQQNYRKNAEAIQNTADKFKKSIFSLGESFFQLTRETRGTVNEGSATEDMFNNLVSVSTKVGMSVDEVTDRFSGFIDKMKEGAVDSKGLTNEMDKRLYEALMKIAKQAGVTGAELNEIFKDSDDAVNNILPQLAAELENALGDVQHKNAQDLGDKIEYTTSKLTVFLDGLFKTSGLKSVFSRAIDDAGDFLTVIDKVNREHGIMAAGGAAISMAGATALGFQHDPYGYGKAAEQKAVTDKKGNSDKASYGLAEAAYDLRRAAEQKAHEKWVKEQKRLAAERKRELDEITRQEIANSNQRIKDGEKAAEAKVNESYENRATSKTPGYAPRPGGTKETYNPSNFTSYTEFVQPLSQAIPILERFAHIVEQINGLTPIDWAEKLRAEEFQREQNYLDQTAQELAETVGQELSAAFEQAGRATFQAVGDMIGAIAMGGKGMQDVGNIFFQIAADLFERMGQALLTASGIFKAGELAIGSMNAGVALAGAVLSFAAASMLKSQIKNSGEQARGRFFTGGIVTGRVGVDNIPVNVSAGEMILNGRDQRQLMGLINGTSIAAMPGAQGMSYGSRSNDTLVSKISGDDMAIAVTRGVKKLNKFR
jgi:hypothetical protein